MNKDIIKEPKVATGMAKNKGKPPSNIKPEMYADVPKNNACPKESIPVYPNIIFVEIATIPKINISVIVALGKRKGPTNKKIINAIKLYLFFVISHQKDLEV